MATKKRASKSVVPAKKSRGNARSNKGVGTRDTCFVIMPFGGYFNTYYESIYVPAVEGAGLEPHRADDLYGPQAIVSDIWDYTKKSRVVLADLTGKNPNVFYELGLAHASAKPVVMVAPSMDDVPFDLRALRIIVYDKNDPEWGDDLREDIERALKEVLSAPLESVLPTFLKVSGGESKTTITPEKKELLQVKRDLDLVKAELRSSQGNASSHRDILEPEEAAEMIRLYQRRGMTDRAIILRLTERGVPSGWVQDRLRKIRGEDSPRIMPPRKDHSAAVQVSEDKPSGEDTSTKA